MKYKENLILGILVSCCLIIDYGVHPAIDKIGVIFTGFIIAGSFIVEVFTDETNID